MRAGDGFPAHRRWCCACLGPAPSPRHSELRQAAPRALSRVALLVGGRAGHSPRLAEPQPRRIEATRGQGRCPKGSGGRRAAAGRPPSLRTRPCLAQSATGSPPAPKWSARVPHQQVLLQQPARQVGSRHGTHAAATRHDRHTAPARHVGRRVTREAAAVTQPRPRSFAPRRDRAAASASDRSRFCGLMGGAVRARSSFARQAMPTPAP